MDLLADSLQWLSCVSGRLSGSTCTGLLSVNFVAFSNVFVLWAWLMVSKSAERSRVGIYQHAQDYEKRDLGEMFVNMSGILLKHAALAVTVVL